VCTYYFHYFLAYNNESLFAELSATIHSTVIRLFEKMSALVPLYLRASPFGFGPWRELDHYFDNFHQLQLRDHAGKLTMGKDGGFIYRLDTSGFQPTELKLSVEGEFIVVSGEHRESNNGRQ